MCFYKILKIRVKLHTLVQDPYYASDPIDPMVVPCGFLMWFFWPWVHNEWEIIKRTSIVQFDPNFVPISFDGQNHQAKCQLGSSSPHVPMTLSIMFPNLFTPRNGTLFYSVRRSTKFTPSRAYPFLVFTEQNVH